MVQKSRKKEPKVIDTRWGRQVIIHNDEDYCGKLLVFRKSGDRISMQYHMEKKETWYVQAGKFLFHWIHPRSGQLFTEILNVGDVVVNEPGDMHQLEAIQDGSIIFEVSTEHRDSDTYRIYMRTPVDLIEEL